MRQFYGCYYYYNDQLFGVVRRRKRVDNTPGRHKELPRATP